MAAQTMEAVGSYRGLPVDSPGSLQDVVVPVPRLRPRDVLVRVRAVSVNPADVKLRASLPASRDPRVLGFDAAGVVEAVGAEVSTLAVGDEVWYAGDITRAGSNAELHAVDERIVALKPASLSYAEAAALPLTTITAWESLFERFRLTAQSRGTLLVMGGAGGVGSIMIQLAKELTGVRVLASASRPESSAWVRDLGADAVVNHHDLVTTTQEQAPEGVEYIFSPHSRGNIDAYATLLRPFGHITAIDEPRDLDLVPLKPKSIAWHWELMFTRPMFGTPDMDAQKKLLGTVAGLVDDKRVRTTATTVIEDFSAAGLREAHRAVESGRTVGKVVVTR
ncbi:zinc-binding alcohol dehydrogenase family protein [Actinacidiphila acididurans]|uniref:Zinc-type alcohol dehydrogenase-like protein n=1 Tax=Actinacidiphila acididurans TaxID=2784346 RepID=A0ABS2TL58_9ACTN|nr:zinc-binding alcohol dehydrogenase family protein [Actinacidiphila acididurans]MBM9504070.1 zinc-binding alcohol dehydrogenase family protein [Actinacidiphila acididurans]